MMCACIPKERGIGRGSVHHSSPTQVLERSRRLSKDEMILRLGDGKAVVAEAVGSLRLVVSNHIRIDLKDCYFVPNNHENTQIWHARLGHISKDRISRLVDLKNLKIDNLDHLPICESCLMRYKSEAFGRFKEYRLEVENQTNRKIKALRSDRGGEYLSGEFIDYLKENRILSQWTPPRTPQLNGVAERRNRTLLDIVRSMMSFTELPPSFWGYALETAAKLLNIVPSKSVNYIQELGVVPSIAEPVVIFCDNNGAIAQAKEPRSHHRSKHILRRYHLLREMVSRGDCRMDRVSSAENTANTLTKSMSQIAHTQHMDKMGLRSMGDWL
ncbi:UNVERIFIED_CONTAM: hypothetical protein Slati_2507100 [Sesamum latifolium]|uniref:Integrase catalytic domain-containing protein n=1 Tax=Sesamum latifolium TaxID=2727402 RepID=A0AAW2WGA8_9LAMI